MKQLLKDAIIRMAQKNWNRVRNLKGYSKEDSLAVAMEIAGEYEDFDPTEDEYQEMLSLIF